MEYSEIYGRLPVAFQPHDFAERGARTKWRAAIHKILPTLPSLPSPGLSLRTTPGNHYQPPRFDFGWKLSASDLAAIAEHHGFLITPLSPSSPSNSTTAATTTTTTAAYSSSASSTFDLVRMTVLLNQFLAAAGCVTKTYLRIDVLSAPPGHHRRSSSSSTTSTLGGGSSSSSGPKTYCITLTDNYRSQSETTNNGVPDRGELERIRGLLDLDVGAPRWHLDGKWCNWQWKRSEEILTEEKVFMKAFLENKQKS